jgi:ABC-2 type transport system ATP-binding protein
VATPTPATLLAALRTEAPQASVEEQPDHLLVQGVTAAQVGAIAFAARVELHALTQQAPDLERLFLQLTTPQETPGAAA